MIKQTKKRKKRVNRLIGVYLNCPHGWGFKTLVDVSILAAQCAVNKDIVPEYFTYKLQQAILKRSKGDYEKFLMRYETSKKFFMKEVIKHSEQ